MKKFISLLFITAISVSYLFSQVNYELRGPKRDGYYPNEKDLLKVWPEQGPELLKTITNIGEGFTLPAVTNDRIYVTGMVDTTGYLFSYDINGNLLWKKAYAVEWTENYPGSRSTPTIVDDKIYFEDSFGMVYCYNKAGEQVWTVDMVKEFGFRKLFWGANESLLIDGDKLYCTPGGEQVMIAVLDKNTGKTINTIKGNGEKSAHCSPVIVKHNNKKLLLTMTAKALVVVDVDKNEMLFESPFFNQWEGNPNTPLYKNGYVLISTQGVGSQVLKLSNDATSATITWENKLYDSENEAAIILDNHVYLGSNDTKKWYCFEFLTGKMKYEDRSIGRANVVYADGLLYTYNSKGYVALVKPNKEKLEIISRFKVMEGSNQHISHIVIKNSKMYIRHGNALNIYNISASKS